MKVYDTLKTKDPIGYILWVNEDGILYHDGERTKAVTAAELDELMFIKGVYCWIDGDVLIAATEFTPTNVEVPYVTLTVGEGTAYTVEHEDMG